MIVVAGATGHLGKRIITSLIGRGARVRALVRRGSAVGRDTAIKGADREVVASGDKPGVATGVDVVEVDYADPRSLTAACTGATCVVSALAGLRDVVVDAQTALLDAAVAAGVPRFIPSDYAIDFTKIPPGRNRNLSLRNEFRARLDRAPLAPTSVLCGAFMDMLTGQAPFILYKPRRVLCWGDPDQPMDFTAIADTAAYTAAVALDDKTPRFLRIAGEQISARGLAAAVSRVTGEEFRILRPGSVAMLSGLIRVAKLLKPAPHELYPPWQGMQYMRDMYSGVATFPAVDNDRYPGLAWTSVAALLTAAMNE